MKLVELSAKDKNDYNRFIINQLSGSFLQSWEWGDWQASLSYKPRRFCYVNDEGLWLAAFQSLDMPLPFKKHYTYLPYGPVFRQGPSTIDLQQMLKEFKNFTPQSLFVRLEPTILPPNQKPIGRKSTNIQPAITMVVDLATTDEALLSNMHPKTRYNIKIAERDGVEVGHELVATPQHGLYVQEAVNLILETQKRQNYRGHNADYYKKLIDFFAVKNSSSDLKLAVYRAAYQRELLASGIMIDFGNARMYLYGGSSEAHRNVMAPYMMHWQAMLDAKRQGLVFYDLGGSEVASGGERGFTRFKRGFGGRVVEYAGAYDVSNKKLGYWLYGKVRVLNRLAKKIPRF